MSQEYNNTLNLPSTDFPMRAGLPVREPEALKKWDEDKLYHKMVKSNEGKPLYILHDGPPYANGDIHVGTAMNKILKDFIIRYKNMSGFCAPYVPGFDTHGLPIELQAIKAYGLDRSKVSAVELRKKCREFALKFMDGQRSQFKRLGVLGDWDNPYLTLKPEFEAKQIEVFGEMAKRNFIYKGMKPVYWCPHDETALAEAEIEYSDDDCDSIYVKFAVTDDLGKLAPLCGGLDKVYFVIWTTTTWTLPGNVAIAVNPAFDYILMKTKSGEIYIVAEGLASSVASAAHIGEYEVLGKLTGKDLEYMKAKHPFLDREALIINGDHVTLESGTGCVHTAPGHGAEDFVACKPYNLPIPVPVDEKGYLNELAGPFAGMYHLKANAAIIKELQDRNALLAVEKIKHTYPHCWRCKNPIVFRATEQWFASIDAFKEDAVAACRDIKWVPSWGEERMISMIRERNDWCISRQRVWGVPIPIFYCKTCGKVIVNDETIHAVSTLFAQKGSDAWYETSAAEILPKGFTCPSCKGTDFDKEKDIMDVWFDSGSSHAAVLETRPDLRWPADLYLEGADQYRGWFQSSLLTSIASRGKAPYKAVLTHGWVVDGEGKKMSKSLGNVINPNDVVNEYGADVLRLWVASSDYQVDVRVSKDMLKQLSQTYLKIRNTARFILGNLQNFNPDRDICAYTGLQEIDKWTLMRLNRLIDKVRSAYENFEYHIVYHALHNFCVVDLSNFYLDVIKDRLYTEKEDSPARRAAQTTMYLILDALVRMLAPILAYTSDEIWRFMPHRSGDNADAVVLNEIPTANPEWNRPELDEKWPKLMALREDVQKALEFSRAQKFIGSSLEASVTLYCGESFGFVRSVQDLLKTMFICSEVIVENGAGEGMKGDNIADICVKIGKAKGEKCERCWIYSETVGASKKDPTLCDRCAKILEDE